MKLINITELRYNYHKVMTTLTEEITVLKNGKPIMVIIPYKIWEEKYEKPKTTSAGTSEGSQGDNAS